MLGSKHITLNELQNPKYKYAIRARFPHPPFHCQSRLFDLQALGGLAV